MTTNHNPPAEEALAAYAYTLTCLLAEGWENDPSMMAPHVKGMCDAMQQAGLTTYRSGPWEFLMVEHPSPVLITRVTVEFAIPRDKG